MRNPLLNGLHVGDPVATLKIDISREVPTGEIANSPWISVVWMKLTSPQTKGALGKGKTDVSV